MPDREKVIREFEYEVKKTHDEDWDFVYLNPNFADKLLALLKEQQQQIWELQDQVEYLTDKLKEQKFLVDSDGKITPLPVVVRCKDCIYGKHEKNESTGKEWIYCAHHRENRPKEWFCASGSRI